MTIDRFGIRWALNKRMDGIIQFDLDGRQSASVRTTHTISVFFYVSISRGDKHGIEWSVFEKIK